jgi:hypothetical protein
MRWAQITETLSDVSQEDFLKMFWTSRNGKTQLDKVFDEVRSQVKKTPEANDLSIDLLESAEYYAALESSDDPAWARYSGQSRELLSTLRLLGSKQAKPIILSAVKRFDPGEFERLLRLLEVVVVRYQLIGEGRTGGIEIAFSRLAQSIWKDGVKNARDALKVLGDIMPNDDAFRDAFSQKDNLSNPKAVYLLKKLEQHERQIKKGGHGQELAVGSLSLEHILPQNPGKPWQGVLDKDPDIVGDCVSRLGNLCLLTEAKNREAADQPFSEKKKLYIASDLFTTQGIAEHEDWNRKSIEHRQAWLAKQAVAVWRFQ